METLPMRPIYDILLRGTPQVPGGLYQLHLLTAEQLTRLHYSPGSLTTIKARLKTLTDYGYVQSDVIPSRQWRTPFYYTLGPAGVRYLESVGADLPPSWRAGRAVNQHWLFVEHTLELNDLLVSALLLSRDAPTVQLHSFEHERSLKRHPYKATWQTNGQTHALTVIPDAFLDFYLSALSTPDGVQRMPILVEHDRGTEEQLYFRRRIRAYIMLLKTGAYQQMFSAKAVTIAFTTFQSAERIEQLRAWTRAELDGEPPALGALFRFAFLRRPLQPQAVWLGPQWMSPYDTGQTGQEPQPLLATA